MEKLEGITKGASASAWVLLEIMFTLVLLHADRKDK